ncbi:hypothetical protein GTY62_15305 [Streptomyces sp. SID724]|uniref:hypothetical protein n=1 Tax=Streptomyces sp. SID724 TaxID=2690324 RepID=UPI00136162E7|nr:hypothetical protein [Streptomyces sp. SID724]
MFDGKWGKVDARKAYESVRALVTRRPKSVPVCILGTIDDYGVTIQRSIRAPHFPALYCPTATARRAEDPRLIFPAAPGFCRIMETRTCPPAGTCSGPCARFESENSAPWTS